MGARQSVQRVNKKQTNVPVREWMAERSLRPVFDTDADGWDKEEFAARVVRRGRVLVVNYTSRGEMLGCYVHRPVKCAGECVRDRRFFLFAVDKSRENVAVYRNIHEADAFLVTKEDPTCLFWMEDLQVRNGTMGLKSGVSPEADRPFRRFIRGQKIVKCDRKLRFDVVRVVVYCVD